MFVSGHMTRLYLCLRCEYWYVTLDWNTKSVVIIDHRLYRYSDLDRLEIEDVEREMETQKQLEEQAKSDQGAASKEDAKEEENLEEMLPPVVEGRWTSPGYI